jgi:hypothetical protein
LEALSGCSGVEQEDSFVCGLLQPTAPWLWLAAPPFGPWNGRQMTCPGMLVDSVGLFKRGHQAAVPQGPQHAPGRLLISVFIGIQSGLARFSIFTFTFTVSQIAPAPAPSRSFRRRPLLPPIIARRQQFPLLSPTASLP